MGEWVGIGTEPELHDSRNTGDWVVVEAKALGHIARDVIGAVADVIPKRGWWAGTGFREELVVRDPRGRFSGRVGGIGAPDVGVAQAPIEGWTDRDLTVTLAESMRDSHFQPTTTDIQNRNRIAAELRRRHPDMLVPLPRADVTNAPISSLPPIPAHVLVGEGDAVYMKLHKPYSSNPQPMFAVVHPDGTGTFYNYFVTDPAGAEPASGGMLDEVHNSGMWSPVNAPPQPDAVNLVPQEVPNVRAAEPSAESTRRRGIFGRLRQDAGGPLWRRRLVTGGEGLPEGDRAYLSHAVAAQEPTAAAVAALTEAHADPVTFLELDHTPEAANAFHDAIDAASKANEHGALVHVYSPAEYQGMLLLIAPNGSTGVAIKPDGDIVSAFANPAHPDRPKGAAASLMEAAIDSGGTHLDAFDPYLPVLYGEHGFTETGRVPFDPARTPPNWPAALDSPDVVSMARRPDVVAQGPLRRTPLAPAAPVRPLTEIRADLIEQLRIAGVDHKPDDVEITDPFTEQLLSDITPTVTADLPGGVMISLPRADARAWVSAVEADFEAWHAQLPVSPLGERKPGWGVRRSARLARQQGWEPRQPSDRAIAIPALFRPVEPGGTRRGRRVVGNRGYLAGQLARSPLRDSSAWNPYPYDSRGMRAVEMPGDKHFITPSGIDILLHDHANDPTPHDPLANDRVSASIDVIEPDGTHARRIIGDLDWYDNGEIAGVVVMRQYRMQNIATEMLAYARSINPEVHHSTMLTDEGRAWSQVAAGPMPERTPELPPGPNPYAGMTDAELAAVLDATDMNILSVPNLTPDELVRREQIMREYISRHPQSPIRQSALPAILPKSQEDKVVTPGSKAILTSKAYRELFGIGNWSLDRSRNVYVSDVGRGVVSIQFEEPTDHPGTFTVKGKDLFGVRDGIMPPGYGTNGRRINIGSVIQIGSGPNPSGIHGVVVGEGPQVNWWQIRKADGTIINQPADSIKVTTATQKFDHLAREAKAGDSVKWVAPDGLLHSDKIAAVDSRGPSVMVALVTPKSKRSTTAYTRLYGQVPDAGTENRVIRFALDDPIVLTPKVAVPPVDLKTIREQAVAALPADHVLIGKTRQNFDDDSELLRYLNLSRKNRTEAEEWAAWRDDGAPASTLTEAKPPYELFADRTGADSYWRDVGMSSDDVQVYIDQSNRTADRLLRQYAEYRTYKADKDPEFAKRGYRWVPDVAADGGPGEEMSAALAVVRDAGEKLARAVQARYQEKLDADKVVDPDILRARRAIISERLDDAQRNVVTIGATVLREYANKKYGRTGDPVLWTFTDRAERTRVMDDLFDGRLERGLMLSDPTWLKAEQEKRALADEMTRINYDVLSAVGKATAHRGHAAQEILTEVRDTGGAVFVPGVVQTSPATPNIHDWTLEPRPPSLLTEIQLVHPPRPDVAPIKVPMSKVEAGDKILNPAGGLSTITEIHREGPAPSFPGGVTDMRPWKMTVKDGHGGVVTATITAEHANAAHATMSVFRGDIGENTTPDPVALKALEAAFNLYPTEWVKAAAGRGVLTLTPEDGSQRGSFNDSENAISLPKSSDDVKPGLVERLDSAMHEVGHLMEESVPGLKALEWAYHTERTTDRTSTGKISRTQYGKRKRTGVNAEQLMAELTGQMGYALWERARGDEYPNPYSGKEYGDGGPTAMRELFTTMVESLLAGAKYGDDDAMAWTLGVLATL